MKWLYLKKRFRREVIYNRSALETLRLYVNEPISYSYLWAIFYIHTQKMANSEMEGLYRFPEGIIVRCSRYDLRNVALECPTFTGSANLSSPSLHNKPAILKAIDTTLGIHYYYSF